MEGWKQLEGVMGTSESTEKRKDMTTEEGMPKHEDTDA
jgi:hypothetical protein